MTVTSRVESKDERKAYVLHLVHTDIPVHRMKLEGRVKHGPGPGGNRGKPLAWEHLLFADVDPLKPLSHSLHLLSRVLARDCPTISQVGILRRIRRLVVGRRATLGNHDCGIKGKRGELRLAPLSLG